MARSAEEAWTAVWPEGVGRCAWTTPGRRPQFHRANDSKTWYLSDEEEKRPSPYERTPVVLGLGSTAPNGSKMVLNLDFRNERAKQSRHGSQLFLPYIVQVPPHVPVTVRKRTPVIGLVSPE